MTKRILVAVSLAMLGSRAAAAQDSTRSVSEVLAFLVTNQSVSTGSIERDRAAAQAASDTISRALLTNLATLPVTTSSGAFAYHVNPELGTVERATQSFGPFFVERALTSGRGTASMGVTFQHTRFDSLDGRSLRDGTLITTANQFVDEPQPFDVDQLALNIDADIATVYGSVGVGDRVEIGFAAPMVALRLSGSRVNTYRGRTFTQASASATALGLADAIVRTKFVVFNEEGRSIAAGVDARLPTGRKDDLLGAGSLATKFSAIGSLEGARLSAHANAGVTVGGLAREIDYGAAVTAVTSPRVTMSAEMLGRWIDSAGHIESVAAPHPTLAGVETLRLAAGTSGLNLLTVAPGIKWNLTDTWVLAANVTVPLTTAGLTSRFIPFVGLDYSLER